MRAAQLNPSSTPHAAQAGTTPPPLRRAGVMWENQQMFDYLENPKKYIKGTNMVRSLPPVVCVRVGASTGEWW